MSESVHILEKYRLIFINRPFTWPDEKTHIIKEAVHCIDNDFLGYFLIKFKDIDDINEIIGDIDFIVAEGFYDREYCLEIYLDFLDITYTDTSAFFHETNGDLLEKIPLTDLRRILFLWKAFIQAEPLHGTEVEKNTPLIYYLQGNEQQEEIGKFLFRKFGNADFTLVKS